MCSDGLVGQLGTKSSSSGDVGVRLRLHFQSDAVWVGGWPGAYIVDFNHCVPLLQTCSSIVVAQDGVFLSKSADQRIITGRSGVLLLIPDRLARWIDDLEFLSILHKRGF